MSAEMDRLIAEFEKFQSKIKAAEDQFANVGQMQEQLAEVEASVTSADRAVRVVAGPGGSIKDIQLTAEALRQQPGALSATIMSTLQQAVANAAQKQAGIVDENVGDAFGINVSEQVLENQAEAFGTSVEELKAQMSDDSAEPPAPAETGSERYTAPDADEAPSSIYDSASTPAPPPPATQRPTPPAAEDWDEDGDEYGHGSVFEK